MSELFVGINNFFDDFFNGAGFAPMSEIGTKAHPQAFDFVAQVAFGSDELPRLCISMERGDLRGFGHFSYLPELLRNQVTTFHQFTL